MATIEVEKNERETNQSLVRRFTKRLRESGVLSAAKKAKFYDKGKSQQLQKRITLRKIEKQKEFERMAKLGKLPWRSNNKFRKR